MKKNLFLFALLAIGLSLNAQYKVGDEVQDFKLKGTDGKMHSMLDEKSANGYIITFTCNTCPVAKKYEQRVIELNKKFAPMGYPVIAINSNDTGKQPGDTMEEMQKRAKDKKYGFAYLRDDDQSVAKRFGAEKTPEIYLVTRNGEKLVLAYTGAIDNNPDSPADANKAYVAMAIENLKNGKKVEVAETRAIGCSIKWTD